MLQGKDNFEKIWKCVHFWTKVSKSPYRETVVNVNVSFKVSTKTPKIVYIQYPEIVSIGNVS